MNKFDKIIELQAEIKLLIEEAEELNIQDQDRLYKFKKLVNIFNSIEKDKITDLFDYKVKTNEDETIDALNNLKKFIEIIIQFEKILRSGDNKNEILLNHKKFKEYINEKK